MLSIPTSCNRPTNILYKTSLLSFPPLDLTLVEYGIQKHRICLNYLEVSVETGDPIRSAILSASRNRTNSNFWNMYSGVISILKSSSSVISLFSSKSIANRLHPVLTSFAHCYSCQVLVQRPVPTCLDCFFQFLEEMRDAIFVRRKRTRYHVSVSMDNDDSSFYPPFP